ncbi:lipopolysaccharide biosynthesis protein [Enterococcus sp. 2201sp1_2201st1_B8_2201SCRN_220225]|uniref:lipopolysaccharide biosynthesis protein n=1 Tax=unclassified Enterococcus TaxID=2608891 RepID=UPI0034A33829
MDRSNKKLLSNVVFSGLFQLLFLLGPIITTPYIARIFTPNSLGVYGTSYTLAMFFVQIAAFGVPFFGSRRISRTKSMIDRSIEFFNIWCMQALTTLLSFFIYIVVVFVFIKSNKNVYFYQSFLILSCLFDISWFYIGIEEIKKNIFRNSISKIITILFIFMFVKSNADLLLYTVINILGVLVGNLTMVFQLKNFISIKQIKNVNMKKENFRESFGLLVPQTVDSVKNVVSRVILASFSSYTQAGLYDQGLKIVTMLNGILQSVTTAIMPRITYLISEGKNKEALNMVGRITSIGTFISTIFICGVLSVTEFFVPIFFGGGYEPVIIIMKISSVSLICTSLSYILGKGLLLSMSKDKEFRKSTYISSLTLIVLTLLLVKYLGATGASFAYLASSVSFLISILYFLRIVIPIKQIIFQIIYSIIVILGVMLIIVNIKKIFIINSFVVGFIIYGCISVAITTICYYPNLKYSKGKNESHL